MEQKELPTQRVSHLVRIRGAVDGPVRKCIYSDELVLETDHVRLGSPRHPGGGWAPAHEFFQIVVTATDLEFSLRARRLLTSGGHQVPGTVDWCPTAWAFPRDDARTVEKVRGRLARAVANPDVILPSKGHRIQRTGMPVQIDSAQMRPAAPSGGLAPRVGPQ